MRIEREGVVRGTQKKVRQMSVTSQWIRTEDGLREDIGKCEAAVAEVIWNQVKLGRRECLRSWIGQSNEEGMCARSSLETGVGH